MIVWPLLFVPGLIAVASRYFFNEDHLPRWKWYSLHLFGAAILSLNTQFGLAWFIFIYGFSGFAWHAIFSAQLGTPPKREDTWLGQWMQIAAISTTKKLFRIDESNLGFWYKFGIVYGFYRAIFLLPGIICLTYHLDSLVPLTGLMFFGQGMIHYWAGKIARRYDAQRMASVFADLMLNWFIGTYLLICLSVSHPLVS